MHSKRLIGERAAAANTLHRHAVPASAGSVRTPSEQLRALPRKRPVGKDEARAGTRRSSNPISLLLRCVDRTTCR